MSNPLLKASQYVSILEVPRSEPLNTAHPSVILLFGWLEAKQMYLQKYVDRLHGLFPSSTIVLVKAYTSYYYTTESSLEKGLSPVVDLLAREMEDAAAFRGVLVHVLSNGGSLQLLALRNALVKAPTRSNPDTPRRRIPVALVLDSTPALRELSSAIQTWAPRNPILYYCSIPPIAALYASFYLVHALTGHPPLFPTMHDRLNSPDLLPSITDPADPKAAPRVYMYSPRDLITPATEIEAHYEAAVALGFDAMKEKFTNSPHVSHSRTDPEKYWGAVNGVWQKALRVSKRTD